MSLKFYRIDQSIFGKFGHIFKKPDLPPTQLFSPIKAISPIRCFNDVVTDNFFILVDKDEISRFRDPRGFALEEDTYYVRHPKKIKTDCLIPATEFHRYVVQEQIADLVSFVRANTSVRKLHVSIGSKKEAEAQVSGILEGIKLEGKALLKKVNYHEVLIDCIEPLKPSERKREYVWLDDFQSTVTIIDNISGAASVTVKEHADLSFGLSLKVADQVGISGDWLSSFEYNFYCELA
ncbi:MAG: hypothetical protein PSV18_01805 [Methylobacter sp.]|nr:hypothetical protein [Candidatus Methylobacter titanis]